MNTEGCLYTEGSSFLKNPYQPLKPFVIMSWRDVNGALLRYCLMNFTCSVPIFKI